MQSEGQNEPKKSDDSVKLMGVPFFSGSEEEVLKRVFETGVKKPLIVFTPNPEQLVQAHHDDTFCYSLQRADVNLPDGIGLVVADRLLSLFSKREWRLKRRLSGVDIMQRICLEAAKRDFPVFLVGGRNGVAKRAAAALETEYKSLQAAAWGGAEDVAAENKAEWVETRRRIQNVGAKIVFVAYGAPQQERWVLKHATELNEIGVEVVMVVGGAVDMVAGEVVRAPRLMRKIGLEWLWRLVQEPWRFKRQLRLVEFVGLVIKEAALPKR